MAWTRGQIIIWASVAYLLVPLAIGSYSLHTIRMQSLPIPKVLSAFILALPVIAAGVIQLNFSAHSRKRHDKHVKNALSRWAPLSLLLLLVYESVVAALSGTYLGPSNSLRCGLEERWRTLYHFKDENSVKRIQDAFQCCGLHSVLDMAWPFPGHGVGANSCESNFGRTTSCFEEWRGEEQKIAGLMLVVVILVFIWKAFITWLWFNSGHFQVSQGRFNQLEEERTENTGRRALDFNNIHGRYLDEPAAEARDRDPSSEGSGEGRVLDRHANDETLL